MAFGKDHELHTRRAGRNFGVAGLLLGFAAIVLNAVFLGLAFRVWRRDEATSEADGFAAEKRLFRFSLAYLFLHFGALLADAALRLSSVTGA